MHRIPQFLTEEENFFYAGLHHFNRVRSSGNAMTEVKIGYVDVLVDSLSSLLEPILIIGMGIVVGFIVVALFMPLLGIINSL